MSNDSSINVSVRLDGIGEAKQGLKGVSDNFKEASKSAEEFKHSSEQFTELGAVFKKVGRQFTKYLTVPMVAGMTGLGKMFSNLEYEVARVGTLTSEAFDLTQYTQDLLDQSKVTGVDTAQLSKNVYTALTASVPEDYVMDFVFDAHKLATAGFTDEATAIDVLTTAINAYGYEAKDANHLSDMLIGTQDRGKTTVDELGKSLGDVIPIAADNGLSFEQLSASMALLTRNGIGTARASTYTRSMLQELGKTGSTSDKALRELSGKGFRGLMDEGYDLSEVLVMLDGYATDNNLTLQDMFGNIRAGTGAMALMSGEGDDLSELIEYMGDVAGRTDENFEDMSQTMQYRTKVAFNRLKTAGYDLALNLAPVWEKVADVMVSVAEKVEGAVKWFSQLEDSTQGTIVKFGLFLIVLGPIISVLGGAFTLIGTISGAIGIMSGTLAVATPAVMGLATVMGFLSNPVTLAIGGMGLLVGAVALVASKLGEEATPQVELFGEEVSETTAKAVGDFLGMTEEVGVALKEMSWGQQEVTQEMADDLKGKQDLITEDLIQAISERHEEERRLMEEHLSGNELLLDESKEDILRRLDEHYEKEQLNATRNGTMINNIIQRALEEEREITSTELALIEELRRDMEETAVEIMSESEVEQRIILERMAQNSGTITAQEAIEVANNSREKKEAVISEAEEQFETTMGLVIRQRDETKTITEAEATAMIKEAERAKEETVSEAEDRHKEIVDIAQEQSDEHTRITEEGNLEVKSSWEKLKESIGLTSTDMEKVVTTSQQAISKTTRDESVNQVTSSRDSWNEMSGNLSNSLADVDESMNQGMSTASSTVTSWRESFNTGGVGIAKSIAQGIFSGESFVVTAVKGLLQKARDLIPSSPPKDKSSPMYGLENNGISSNIAEGIMKGEGEIDFAMRRVLQNDMASKYQSRNSVSKAVSPSKKLEEVKAKQPVELVIQLGNHEFRKFVADITNVQDKDLGFTKSFGV